MPPWSEEYGGPLRLDQIRDIAQFIMNWESTALGEVVIEELPTPTPRPEEAEDPVARGLIVYNERGCGGCHTIEGISAGIVGPNLSQVGSVAGTRVPDQSAEDYLRESILNPNAHIVEGFQPNIMPQNFGELISPEQLSDLIAFLLAQQ
jgi:mono/diheme cytochrome c family protein